MQIVLGGIILLLALVGFWFTVMLIRDLISSWWHDRKIKRSFGNDKLRQEAIKKAKLEVLNNIHMYCELTILTYRPMTDNQFCLGARDGMRMIKEHVERLSDVIKEA